MDLRASRRPAASSAPDPEEVAELLSKALERERAATIRAERLSRANDLLRESAERLGVIDDIDAFLGQVLWSIHSLLGGHSAAVWVFDHAKGLSHLRYVVEEDRAIPATQSAHPNASSPSPIAEAAKELMPGFSTTAATPIQTIASDERAFTREHRAYFQNLGVRSVVSVPMVLRGQHFGNFTVRLIDEQPLLDEEREMIQTLANQAAVALQLTSLADQARQAAIAIEREAAAQSRAEKLAQANHLLRTSAESLGAIEDIDAFLGQVLLSITQQLGADSSSVWVDNEDHTLSRLRYVVEEGRAVPAAASRHPNANVPGKLNAANTAVQPGHGSAAAQPVLHDVATTTGMESEVQRDYLLSLGVKALLTVPMVLNGRHLGNFNIRLTDDRPLLEDERELIQALATLRRKIPWTI